jgi:hypothetical protein
VDVASGSSNNYGRIGSAFLAFVVFRAAQREVALARDTVASNEGHFRRRDA